MDADHGRTHSFERFFERCEPPVRYALCGVLGPDVGRDAAAEAFTVAWTRWETVSRMDNAAGYVYRTGLRYGRRQLLRRRRTLSSPWHVDDIWVEPGLGRAVSSLPPKQRAVVLLVHGVGLTQREAAEVLGVSAGTVQSHIKSAMETLRAALGVEG